MALGRIREAALGDAQVADAVVRGVTAIVRVLYLTTQAMKTATTPTATLMSPHASMMSCAFSSTFGSWHNSPAAHGMTKGGGGWRQLGVSLSIEQTGASREQHNAPRSRDDLSMHRTESDTYEFGRRISCPCIGVHWQAVLVPLYRATFYCGCPYIGPPTVS